MSLKDWQKEREQEKRQNQKLEVVSYLRNSSARNRQRMGQVRSIMYGDSYALEEMEVPNSYAKSEEEQRISNVREEQAFWLSFFRRVILCGAIFALLYMGDMSGNMTAKRYKKEIKTLITIDYSENLFDFIQQIPYTFDYEKINVEG